MKRVVKYVEKLDKRDWNSAEEDNDCEKQCPEKNRLDLKKAKCKVLSYGLRKWMKCVKTNQLFVQKIMSAK